MTFKPGKWQSKINVRDFIQQNYGKNAANYSKKKEKMVAF